jgi:putative addiction module component (TIGR02574 family)
MTSAEILPQILKMSRNEQLMITDALLRSLHDASPETHSEFMAELDRRVEEMKSHPESAIAWEELDQELDRL